MVAFMKRCAKLQAMTNIEPLLARLHQHGLLLQQDKHLPDVASAIAGEPIRGSWWAHPRAYTIFACLSELEQHPDILLTKLVAGKVTSIERRLWPAVLPVGIARAVAVRGSLGARARALRRGRATGYAPQAAGRNAKQLEQWLLVHGQQAHTDAGRHELRLERWELWADRVGAAGTLTAQEGQLQLEAAMQAIGGTVALLPWAR
jgi:hypothetical protein